MCVCVCVCVCVVIEFQKKTKGLWIPCSAAAVCGGKGTFAIFIYQRCNKMFSYNKHCSFQKIYQSEEGFAYSWALLQPIARYI